MTKADKLRKLGESAAQVLADPPTEHTQKDRNVALQVLMLAQAGVDPDECKCENCNLKIRPDLNDGLQVFIASDGAHVFCHKDACTKVYNRLMFEPKVS